jgi:DNA repair photolyase
MFVRWENLTVDEDEEARLPGYREPAVVRRFQAPEALETRFYEVRAKSVLNRVPEASRMPFRWTVNPYRGCTHSCVYCVSGETAILMANGGTRPLHDVAVGDEIYGTVRDGRYRRFAKTQVLAKWSSIKRAYTVTLEDGTELVASGDHRFLTGRGWKHVVGSEQGSSRRPHLTLNSKLLGIGGNVPAPNHDSDYRRGYLTGLIRGDGTLGSYSYDRPGRRVGDVHRFRLALTDVEALQRAREYLLKETVTTDEFVFLQATSSWRQVGAIRTQARANVERIRELIVWPVSPGPAWIKGFLAGIFDAEGSCSCGIWRVSNTDPEIIAWIVRCLQGLGFSYVVECRSEQNMVVLRMRGGLPEHTRFFLATDPAITRKRSIEGKALKTNAALRVRSIEPLPGVMRLYDITTGTGDFIANGVVSHNCFARPTHRYLDFDAGRDFEREIVVKVNAPERLRVELARPSWRGEHVALGTNTDPYQWVEGRYRLMPGIWEAFRDAANPCSVLTKSPLLLRDLDLMREINERTSFSAALSVPTLDERAWRATEPHTPNPRARLEAVGELTRAGIETGVLIAPLMPGINDSPEQVGRIVELATEAGASFVSGIALHLRGEVRELFFEWLRNHRPDLIDRYKDLYHRRAYAPMEERKRLGGLVKGPDTTPARRMRGVQRPPPEQVSPSPQRDPQQRLF